jgi:hypothetical protein
MDAEIRDEIAAAPFPDLAQLALGERARKRLRAPLEAGAERLAQQLAQLRVRRRIDLAEEALLVGHHHARAPESLARRERPRVAEHLLHVGVACDVDEARDRPRDRRLAPHRGEHGPHLLRLARVERIEREPAARPAHSRSAAIRRKSE